LTDAHVEFGLIAPEQWHQPDWIDEEKASAAREDMVRNNVIYGGAFFLIVLLNCILMDFDRQRSVS
jgi:Glycolipid 2-alpha-mannosyltransferase